MIAVVALILLLRGPIADRLWPVANAEALRQQAEAALQQGRLSAEDGSGARELFEAAVAIDPDRAELRSGLSRVAQAALQQARSATGSLALKKMPPIPVTRFMGPPMCGAGWERSPFCGLAPALSGTRQPAAACPRRASSYAATSTYST